MATARSSLRSHDPGSTLEALAAERGFRACFAGEAEVGGRYSALSAFGLVPAALMGLDLEAIVGGALAMAEACRRPDPADNPGLRLGLELGTAWHEGRDKVILNPNPGEFGLWVEQLIAESTGKEGKGLVPCPDESPDGADRQPAAITLEEIGGIGAEFYRFECATAIAGAMIGIHPFDQPNVQEAKDRTGAILAGGEQPVLDSVSSLDEVLDSAEAGDYVAVLAFVPASAENERSLGEAARGAECANGSAYDGRLRAALPPTRPGSFTRAALAPGSSSRLSTIRPTSTFRGVSTASVG